MLVFENTHLFQITPASLRKAAENAARQQLKEALQADDPKMIKGAVIAAKRLNAEDLPECQAAMQRYQQAVGSW